MTGQNQFNVDTVATSGLKSIEHRHDVKCCDFWPNQSGEDTHGQPLLKSNINSQMVYVESRLGNRKIQLKGRMLRNQIGHPMIQLMDNVTSCGNE